MNLRDLKSRKAEKIIPRASEFRQPQYPILFRLPRRGEVDPWWSLNRSAWNQLILPHAGNGFRPQIKSVTTRQIGRHRGIRLVVFESAKAFFDKLMAEQLNPGA